MHYIQEKLLKIIGEKNIGNLTLREIGNLVEERFPQKIKHHLLQLQKKGFIAIDKDNNLIKRVSGDVKESDIFLSIPIFGPANCGPRTIYADQNITGYLKVSKKLLPKTNKLFALKAEGNSLNKADINGKNIEDGDFVIIDSEVNTPKTGDYVVSVVDGMANIKKVLIDKNNFQIALISESTQNYNPIFIHEDDDAVINGKVVDVIKKPNL